MSWENKLNEEDFENDILDIGEWLSAGEVIDKWKKFVFSNDHAV